MSVIQKIWAHSGDSHFIEPKGLWHDILPKDLAERMPRITQVEKDGRPMEEIHVDGQVFHSQSRRSPRSAPTVRSRWPS